REILVQTPQRIEAIVEDKDLYNMYSDPSISGIGIGPDGRCVIFRISESGLPVLGPLPAYYLDISFADDMIARFLSNGELKAGGGSGGNTLETPTDGAIDDGAVNTWVVGETTYTDAIDNLNGMLGKLLPPPPPALSTKTLSIASSANARGGANILLASGVASNVPSRNIAPGTQVVRVGSLNVASSNVTEFGDGMKGVLTAHVNGAADGAITLSDADNSGTNGALTIVSDVAFPADK